VLRSINSFLLGAHSVDPSLTVQVIFTGDWSVPSKEAEATIALADAEIDCVNCHIDDLKVVLGVADQRNMSSFGLNKARWRRRAMSRAPSTPAFGYSAPHPSAEGTSTPMIHALPSAHYQSV
jgi:basic membrane lipoprotein Med (substrate-binding protein (PBP1-ABC) superfamily)